MIRLTDIGTDYFTGLSFEVRPGTTCKIIMNSEHEKSLLRDIILGKQRPLKGSIYIFDIDLYSLSESESVKIFKRIGMVWKDGGLISNLKVWENISLPTWYHKGLRAGDIEESVGEFFKRMGMEASNLPEFMAALPGNLSIHERKLVGLARAVSMEPELMIYDSLFEGESFRSEKHLLSFTREFHEHMPGRVSLYLTSAEQSMKSVEADTVVRQTPEGFES